MTNPEHVEIVKAGAEAILKTRESDSKILFDLYKADLSGADLKGADLREANLREADLSEANLNEAWLLGTIFGKTDLSNAILSNSHWGWTNIGNVNFTGVAGLADAIHL